MGTGRPRPRSGLLRMRFSFHAVSQVRKYAWSPSTTMLTAVPTGVPARLYVVSKTAHCSTNGSRIARRCSSFVCLPAATVTQANPRQNDHGEHDLEAQADELCEVVCHGEGVGLGEVKREMRHGVDELGEERDLHEAPAEHDRGARQEHAEGEVQFTNVTDQVLVVRTQRRHPIAAGGREVCIEGLRQEQGPYSDDQFPEGDEREAGPDPRCPRGARLWGSLIAPPPALHARES